jgi:hypothetical protein
MGSTSTTERVEREGPNPLGSKSEESIEFDDGTEGFLDRHSCRRGRGFRRIRPSKVEPKTTFSNEEQSVFESEILSAWDSDFSIPLFSKNHVFVCFDGLVPDEFVEFGIESGTYDSTMTTPDVTVRCDEVHSPYSVTRLEKTRS